MLTSIPLCLCRQMKYTKLKEDWMVIVELLRQHKDRTDLLLSKKASETYFLKILLMIVFKQDFGIF